MDLLEIAPNHNFGWFSAQHYSCVILWPHLAAPNTSESCATAGFQGDAQGVSGAAEHVGRLLSENVG